MCALTQVRNAEFPRALKDVSENFGKAIAATHFGVLKTLRPSPAKPFYAWNMRHVERLFDGGILRTTPDSVRVSCSCLVRVFFELFLEGGS